jgi:hypothetical protein
MLDAMMDNIQSVPETTIQLRYFSHLGDDLHFTRPLDAADASEHLCLRQVSLRQEADEQPHCAGALVALYKAWVENTWLRRDLAFRIIVPLQSFDEQQILRVPDDSHHTLALL